VNGESGNPRQTANRGLGKAVPSERNVPVGNVVELVPGRLYNVIGFDIEKAEINKPGIREGLDPIIRYLRTTDDARPSVLITGHASESRMAGKGAEAYEQGRADAVKSYLISQGVNKNWIRTTTSGSGRLPAGSYSPEQKATARAATVEITPSGERRLTKPPSPPRSMPVSAQAGFLGQDMVRNQLVNMARQQGRAKGYEYTYSWRVAPYVEGRVTPESAMATLQRFPNAFFPFQVREVTGQPAMSALQHTFARGSMDTRLRAGHYYSLDNVQTLGMPGPDILDLVVVIDFAPTSFTFQTKPPHFDTGTITFRTYAQDGFVILEHHGVAREAPRRLEGGTQIGQMGQVGILASWSYMATRLSQALNARLGSAP